MHSKRWAIISILTRSIFILAFLMHVYGFSTQSLCRSLKLGVSCIIIIHSDDAVGGKKIISKKLAVTLSGQHSQSETLALSSGKLKKGKGQDKMLKGRKKELGFTYIT